MARVKRRPGIGRVTRYCVPVAAVAGPTVLLNADYLTDTILDEVSAPVGNGSTVTSWTMATGGVWTSALAVAAGAADQPTYITASGVHTNGASAALTVATPITIPANADCVIYVKAKLSISPTFYAFGSSTVAGNRIAVQGDGDAGVDIMFSGTTQISLYYGTHTAGVYLYRFRRSGSSWYIARTGDAEQSATVSGTATAAISLDTMLGQRVGGTLDTFSATGEYLQKAYIYHGSSSPDTTYETNNGGVL